MRKFKKLKRFKKRKINANKIYLLDWEKTKPYTGNKKYSEFYTQLSNDILNILQQKPELVKEHELGIADCKKLAMMIASYFEDYINEIGIWDYFVKKNQKLYGWSVPFYLTDEAREPDEIYEADIAFIIWFFVSQTNDVLVNPDFPVLLDIADEVFEIFEEKMDAAPTTDFYDGYFNISDDINFFDLKKRLSWLAFGNYLSGFEFAMEFRDAIEDLKDSNPEIFQYGMEGEVIYGMQDTYNFTERSSLSAISNLEWFANIAKCSEKTRKDIQQLHKKIMGKFIYEGENEKYFHFKNIHTNIAFSVLRDSFSSTIKQMKVGDLAAFSIIQWQNDWWLSGMFMLIGQEKESEIEAMRRDISSIPFYAYSQADQDATWEVVDDGHKDFLEFFGNQFVIFENKGEMQLKMNDFYVFQRKQAMLKKGKTLSREDIQETKDSTARMLASINLGIGRTLAAISVEKVGLSFSELIPDLIDNLKSKQLTPQVKKDLFFDLFIHDLHPRTGRYILDNYPTNHLVMPFRHSSIDLVEHADFFFRFYSPNEFGEKVPNMRVIPEGRSVEDYQG